MSPKWFQGGLTVFVAGALAAPGVSWGAGEGGEPEITASGAEGFYLRAMHAKVHQRWADNFLEMAKTQLPPGHALNDAGLRVELELTLARAGGLVDVKVKAPSGAPEFDQAAVEVIKDAAPMPGAPEGVLSDDDQVHLTWSLARDHRRCGEVKVFQKEGPLEEALPRLLASKRDVEALRRVRAAAAASPDQVLGLFAKTWLKRAMNDPKLAPRAAVALLAAGDRAGESAARAAVKAGDAGAGLALARARVPICEMVREHLEAKGTPGQAAAVRALQTSPDPACAAELVAMVEDRALPASIRAAALDALAEASDAGSRRAVAAAEKDPDVLVRAAAIRAGAQPGGGRAALFKLTPLLRSHEIEVRMAAVTGLLRSNGDAALSQLFLLFKETDPRPFEAAAAGLAKLSSEASAQMLEKLLRRDSKRVRVAAAAALAARADVHASSVLEKVKQAPEPDVRVFAASLMTADERQQVAGALAEEGPRLFPVLATTTARAAAADWLLTRLDGADPSAQADLLGGWLTATAARGAVAAAPAAP